MLPFWSCWYVSSFLIAAALMIFFRPLSVDVNDILLFFLLMHWSIFNTDDFARDKQFFHKYVLCSYKFLSLLLLLLFLVCCKAQNGINAIYISCVKDNNNIVQQQIMQQIKVKRQWWFLISPYYPFIYSHFSKKYLKEKEQVKWKTTFYSKVHIRNCP